MTQKQRSTKSIFQQTKYLTSAAQLKQCPEDQSHEVAFVGRSNAGKSSAINCLCQQKSLAKTSKTPGRTQLINFFQLGTTQSDTTYLVDLPGYGFAKVPVTIQKHWQNHLADYLNQRKSLKGVILLMDARHPMQAFDEVFLNWSKETNTPCHILLTKADKLKKGAQTQALSLVEQAVKKNRYPASIQLFSATSKLGMDQAMQVISDWLEIQEER